MQYVNKIKMSVILMKFIKIVIILSLFKLKKIVFYGNHITLSVMSYCVFENSCDNKLSVTLANGKHYIYFQR